MNRTVLIASDIAQEIQPSLAAEFSDTNFVCASGPNELAERLNQFKPEVVLSIKGPNFPAEYHHPIMSFPSVKWVQVGGSGYDHLWPWDRERLVVSNCAGVLAPYLAETVIGAMIGLNGNFLTYFRQQQQCVWLPHEFRPLSEQTILIVGLGHIGSCVANIAKSLGMRVIALRRKSIEHPSVDLLGTPEDLPSLIGQADVVSVHLRMSDETNKLFDTKMFAKSKQSSLFINTSRGKIVDEPALIEALRSGHIRAAYLDVFADEPLAKTSPLWGLPNVFITPHASDNVAKWQHTFARFFAENLHRWNRGEALRNLV